MLLGVEAAVFLNLLEASSQYHISSLKTASENGAGDIVRSEKTGFYTFAGASDGRVLPKFAAIEDQK